MDVNADRVTEAIADLWREIPRSHPDGVWWAYGPDVIAMVTGVPFPTLNGVWVIGESASIQDVSRLLDELPAAGHPYCLQARDGQRARMAGIAKARGMTAGPDIPTMVLTQEPAERPTGDLVIRELSRHEFSERDEVAASGFEVTVEQLREATKMFGSIPGYRIYLGEVDGSPVTTAASIDTAHNSVGIFDVATDPEHRGHGYASAITVHALRSRFRAGATWAWLQSSPVAVRTYEGLGFRTLENWALWIAES